MTTKYIQPGTVLDYPNTSGATIAGGSIVKLKDSLAIALADIPNNTSGPVAVEGVYEAPKVAGNAWVIGEKLVWDVSAGPAFSNSATTVAAGDLTGAAIAAAAAASADTIGLVKFTPGNTTQT